MTVIAGRMELMEAPQCPMASSDQKPWGRLSGLCGLSDPHIPTSLPLILLYSARPNRIHPSRPAPHRLPRAPLSTGVLRGTARHQSSLARSHPV